MDRSAQGGENLRRISRGCLLRPPRPGDSDRSGRSGTVVGSPRDLAGDAHLIRPGNRRLEPAPHRLSGPGGGWLPECDARSLGIDPRAGAEIGSRGHLPGGGPVGRSGALGCPYRVGRGRFRPATGMGGGVRTRRRASQHHSNPTAGPPGQGPVGSCQHRGGPRKPGDRHLPAGRFGDRLVCPLPGRGRSRQLELVPGGAAPGGRFTVRSGLGGGGPGGQPARGAAGQHRIRADLYSAHRSRGLAAAGNDHRCRGDRTDRLPLDFAGRLILHRVRGFPGHHLLGPRPDQGLHQKPGLGMGGAGQRRNR